MLIVSHDDTMGSVSEGSICLSSGNIVSHDDRTGQTDRMDGMDTMDDITHVNVPAQSTVFSNCVCVCVCDLPPSLRK